MTIDEIKNEVEKRGFIFVNIQDKQGIKKICAFNPDKDHPYRYFHVRQCKECGTERLLYGFSYADLCRKCYHKVMTQIKIAKGEKYAS